MNEDVPHIINLWGGDAEFGIERCAGHGVEYHGHLTGERGSSALEAEPLPQREAPAAAWKF